MECGPESAALAFHLGKAERGKLVTADSLQQPEENEPKMENN